MDTAIMAALIAEGGKLISDFIRLQRVTAAPKNHPPRTISENIDVHRDIRTVPPEIAPLIGYQAEEEAPKEVAVNTLPPIKKVSREDKPRWMDTGSEVDSSDGVVGGFESAQERATSIKSGCLPCALGHFGTCSALLPEAKRYAIEEGIDTPEVIDRVGECLDELNAMERIDLKPEMTADLEEWEKEAVNRVLRNSRTLRHGLENLSDPNQLEHLAALAQTTRKEAAREWFGHKLKTMNPVDKENITERVMERINESSFSPEEREEIRQKVVARINSLSESPNGIATLFQGEESQ